MRARHPCGTGPRLPHTASAASGTARCPLPRHAHEAPDCTCAWRCLLGRLVVQVPMPMGSWETCGGRDSPLVMGMSKPPLTAQSPPRSRAATPSHSSRPASVTPAGCAAMALRCAGVSDIDARANHAAQGRGCHPPRQASPASESARCRACPAIWHACVHEAMAPVAALMIVPGGGACLAGWMCRFQAAGRRHHR